MDITGAIITAVREAREAKLDISFTIENIGEPTESISFNAYGAPPKEPAADGDRRGPGGSFVDAKGCLVGFEADHFMFVDAFKAEEARPFPATVKAVQLPKFCLGEKVYLPARVVTVSHHDEGRPTFTLEMEDRHGNQVLVVVDEADPLKEAEPRLASDAP